MKVKEKCNPAVPFEMSDTSVNFLIVIWWSQLVVMLETCFHLCIDIFQVVVIEKCV